MVPPNFLRPRSELDDDVLEPQMPIDRIEQSTKCSVSDWIWSSRQKMWASSLRHLRTRITHAGAPCASLRWQQPNSAMRSGRSRYDLMPWFEDLHMRPDNSSA